MTAPFLGDPTWHQPLKERHPLGRFGSRRTWRRHPLSRQRRGGVRDRRRAAGGRRLHGGV